MDSRKTGQAPSLPEFQGGQGEEGEDQRGDPEADDDLRFGPAQQFEVMVDGGHLEDALLAQLVGGYLQDDGEGFNHEDAADEGEKQFLLDHDGDGANGATQGK